MPNKLRVAVEINGVRRAGTSVKEFMKAFLPSKTRIPAAFYLKPKKDQLEWLFERVIRLDKKMWIFREPARIKPEHSGYKQLLRSWGIFDVTGETRRIEMEQREIRWDTIPRVTRITPNPQNRRTVRAVPAPMSPELSALAQQFWGTPPSRIDFFGEQTP